MLYALSALIVSACVAPPMFALFILGAPLFWLQLWRQRKAV